jgi:hypothetical protein
MRPITFFLLGLLILVLSACVTAGQNFRSDDLSWIVVNKTSQAEIQRTLGEPFRVGVDAGSLTWTYGYYRYRLFGETRTKDLVIEFNREGKVSSYTFNTSFPEEKAEWKHRTNP